MEFKGNYPLDKRIFPRHSLAKRYILDGVGVPRHCHHTMSCFQAKGMSMECSPVEKNIPFPRRDHLEVGRFSKTLSPLKEMSPGLGIVKGIFFWRKEYSLAKERFP